MIRLFASSLRFRWFEHLAAAAMIAFLVAAMLVQGSLSTSAEGTVHELAHDLGKNMLVLPAQMDRTGFHRIEYGDTTLPDDYEQRIRRSSLASQIGSVQRRLYRNVKIDGVAAVVVGQSDLYSAVQRIESDGPPRVLVGKSLAVRLALAENDLITVRGSPLAVDRIVEDLPRGLDMAVITDLSVAQSILEEPGRINAMFLAGCWCSIDVIALSRGVEEELPGTQAITLAGVLEAQTGTIDAMKRYSGDLNTIALALIAGLTALLTAFQARRQKHEIGLFLAVGASPARITAWLVGMASLVALLGSAAGLLVAGPLTDFVGDVVLGTTVPHSTNLFLPVLLMAVAMSVLGAAWPARRAAGVDPTTVLHEI